MEESSKENVWKNGLYVWGRGVIQLGIGDLENREQPTVLEEFFGKIITSVSLGFEHSIAVTQDGEVYTWGANYSGQLGHGDLIDRLKPTPLKSFAMIKALKKMNSDFSIISVSAGGVHSAALTNGGEVWIWGKNTDGQLGNPEESQLSPRLVLSLHQHKIVQIACGDAHTLALDDKGRMFSWGRGKYGRLGHKNEKNYPTPKVIQFFVKPFIQIIRVCCG